MKIIPLIRCKDMPESLFFYTHILDFEWVGTWPESGSPSFTILKREEEELHLSTPREFYTDDPNGNTIRWIKRS